MQIDELKALCDKADEYKLDHVVLQMPAPKSWVSGGRAGERVRSPFGLCRWTGGYHNNNIVVFPTTEQVRKYIAKAESEFYYRIVVDQEKMTATVIRMNLGMEKLYEGHPTQKLLGQRFMSLNEANKCLLWATGNANE